jgi:hypothetical protein
MKSLPDMRQLTLKIWRALRYNLLASVITTSITGVSLLNGPAHFLSDFQGERAFLVV